MPKNRLIEGCRAMGLDLNQEQIGQICLYHEMLTRAGKTMNLTRVGDGPLEAADRNYLDSLTLLVRPELIRNVGTLADVGTGAGLPGILLSIALPDVAVTLIDALAKRVSFLREVIGALGLNAHALHARSEDAGRNPSLRDGFDLVVARAVADTPLLLELALPLAKPGGHFIAYKGPAVEEELARSGKALDALCGRVLRLEKASVPGRDWDHRLLVVEKTAPTPASYPRKAGTPVKKPLG